MQPRIGHDALRAWMGVGAQMSYTCSDVWFRFLGQPGLRDEFVSAMEQELNVEWSPDQKIALQEIVAPVAMLEAPVGAGKTKLCAALSAKLSKDGLVVVVSDTKALCAEHYAEAIRLCDEQRHPRHTVARLGFDDHGRSDFFLHI